MGHDMPTPNGQIRLLERLMASGDTCPAGCGCHTGPFTPCSVPGGCGSEGCGNPARGGGCLTCRLYDPQNPPTRPERARVCDRCRMRLSSCIEAIGRYHDQLVNPDPVEFDDRWYEAHYEIRHEATGLPVGRTEERRADPLGAIGGVGPIPGRRPHGSQTHTGTRSVGRPAPTSLDVLDLAGPARHLNLTRDVRTDLPNQRPDDEAGHLSVATVLADIAADWRDTLWPDQHLPEPTVVQLVEWLRAGADFDTPGVRIDQACDEHPAIADTAEELKRLRGALRRATGDVTPQATPCDGVECNRCSLRTLQWRTDGIEGVECVNPACLKTFTIDEYRAWVAHLGGYEASIRRPEEVTALLRQR
ncbi:MAG TPA: hypothetical protein VF062_09275 [Candidatus Limnocylindrales bacterium]